MFGLTTTRRLRAELADAKAETDRQRLRAEHALELQETAETNRAQVLRQNADLDEKYADVCIVNECLTEDLVKAKATEWQTKYEAEKRRADHLQRRLNDAMGLNTSQVEDGRLWQSTRQDGGGRKQVAP